MRIRSWLLMGIGYLAGTRAGRERFEELRHNLENFAQSDLVMTAMERAREQFGLSEGQQQHAEIRLPDGDEDDVLIEDEADVVDEDETYDEDEDVEREDATSGA